MKKPVKKKSSGIAIKRAALEKGLKRQDALRKMLRKFPGDYLGFVYDPKTGRAAII